MTRENIDFSNPHVLSLLARTLTDKAPLGYVILDKNLRVRFFNQFYLDMRKLDPETVRNNYCYNYTNGGVPCRPCVVLEAIASGEKRYVSRRDMLPDGTVCHIDDFAIPLKNASGEFDYVLEVVIDRTRERHTRENNEKVFIEIIEALTSILDQKDLYTAHHSHDVTEISVKLARHIGLAEMEVQEIRLASLLHDIGKIYIPDSIINKPSALTPDEYVCIQRHSTETLNLLSNLSQFASIRAMAGHHHERWDGEGYPHRLAGENIPLGSRIINIADAYDAVTSNRPYRNALSHDFAMREIHANAGTQFDPVLAKQFIEMVDFRYGSRQSLIDGDFTSPSGLRSRSRTRIERQLPSPRRLTSGFPSAKSNREIFSESELSLSLMENSPCMYSIIDKNFNILYAGGSLARESGMSLEKLRTMRCFEVNNKNVNCFAVKNGTLKCPAVRAFQTGEPQRGKLSYAFDGGTHYCDVYAIPLGLPNTRGETVPCVMEIIFDRTCETDIRIAMEADVRCLLENLFRMVDTLDESTTRGSEEILRKCADISEYLMQMGKRLHTLNALDRGIGHTDEEPVHAG